MVGMKTVRDGDPVTTLTVNIATNFSESNKIETGETDENGDPVKP